MFDRPVLARITQQVYDQYWPERSLSIGIRNRKTANGNGAGEGVNVLRQGAWNFPRWITDNNILLATVINTSDSQILR